MKIVSNELKIALKQPTTQRKGRILVNGNYYEVYNVEYYADAYNEGNVIGNAIASQLDFDLPYMDKFETFKYYDGVWTGAEYEYVDMGTFTVFDEQDEDEFNKHITAFDNLIKFNKQFEDVGGYPKTLYQELENICSQAEVELQNESIPNGSFVVENNQFVEGENLKVVLKAIEQISGTYGIIKNDKLVLQLKNQTSEEINKNEHEPITWKRRSYGINQVILGMEDVQGEYVLRQDDEDIAINGIHKLVINDNPFVYTQQKREQVIDELFNQIKGFGYVPYDLKMEWLNYMDIGDTISIDGIETLILRMYGKSPKSLESEMSAPAIIDSAVEYSNNTFSLTKRVSRTEFGVDKNAKEIQGIIETTETIQKEINPIKDESGSEIIIEDASNNPLTYLEIEGKSTQETRSGKNLLPNVATSGTTNGLTFTVNEDGTIRITGTSSARTLFNINVLKPIILEANKQYTLSKKGNDESIEVYIRKSSVSELILSMGGTQKSKTFTNTYTEDVFCYIAIPINTQVDVTIGLQLEEGSTATEYEAYGAMPSPDYPSEIESVGYENLLNNIATTQTINGVEFTINNDKTITANGTATAQIVLPISDNIALSGTYRLSGCPSGGSSSTYEMQFYGSGNAVDYGNNNAISTNPNGIVRIVIRNGTKLSNLIFKPQLEEGTIAHSYIPYGKYGIEVETSNETNKNTLLIVLNAPLRSLPNGVKDKAYIRNNKLYVDRYVGSVVLNGSEEWRFTSSGNYFYVTGLMDNYKKQNEKIISSHFVGGNAANSNLDNVVKTGNAYNLMLKMTSLNALVDEFKTWLSTNNTQVDYELETPVTEELGEIEMLKTLKGYNNISTTDVLLPIINLTYVRDTILADYVENHVAELKLTEKEIKTSVETVSSSVDGLNTSINRVEEITNDNSQVINIISTNIDKASGEVREVTTTTGFTFNADGMTIDDGSGFKAQHRATGTYYKDGESITGQYTKDGSKQKDLELFGTYSYGKESIDDTPMFVGQLYNDENGEECFGHFYNGGDY